MNQYDPIRNTLKDFKVSVDKDKLWANTAHAIPKKRKKRGVFFLLAGSLLIGALLVYQLGNGDAESSSEVTNETIQTTNLASGESKMNQGISVDENLSAQPVESMSSEQSTKNDNRMEDNVAGKNETNDLSSVTAKNQPVISKRSTNEIGSIPGNPETAWNKESSSTDHNHIATTPQVIENTDEQIKAIANSDFSSSVQPSDYNVSRDLAISPIIESLSLTPFDVNSNQITPSLSGLTDTNPKKHKIRLQLLQGYGWSSLMLSAKDDALSEQADYWQANMRSLENLSTNLAAVLRVSKSIQIMGGLQYSRLTTEIVTQDVFTEQYQTEGITTIVIDSDGERQSLLGQVEGYRETHIKSTRYTTQQRLDAELLLSLAFQRSARFESSVWIKGAYNLLYQAEGTTFDRENSLVSFENNNNPYTLTSPFTFGAGLSSMYRLHPRWTIDARIGYERFNYTHGWFDDDLIFTQNLFNLSLGTSYTF